MDHRIVLEELRKVEDKDGRVTPVAVVDHARPVDNPIHGQFEWNDAVAGERYRIDQARSLIRSVKVTVEVEERKIRTVAYVRDPEAPTDQQGYRSIVKIATEEDNARAAIVSAFGRAATHLRKARELAEALGLAADIDALIAQVADVDMRIRSMPPETRA